MSIECCNLGSYGKCALLGGGARGSAMYAFFYGGGYGGCTGSRHYALNAVVRY